MQKYIDKTQKSQPAAAAQAKQGKAALQLEDNRPQSIVQKKANNTGLPDNLKSGIENLSGHSMDDVKVHYNSSQPAQLNAHAYAQGTDIHLASGQEKHLPHEAWHVVQQKQGRVKPTVQLKGKVNINDDTGLEKEADVMGAKALSGTTVTQTKSFSSVTITKPVVQGVFKTLSEKNIKVLTYWASMRGENLDVQYLQGLYIMSAEKAFLDEQQTPEDFVIPPQNYDEEYIEEEDEDYVMPDQGGVQGMEEETSEDEEEGEPEDLALLAQNDDADQKYLPDFFIKVGKINLSYFTGEPALGKTTKLFARAEALEQAEALDAEQGLDNAQQILAKHAQYWNQDEDGPVTLVQIKQNIMKFYAGLNDGGETGQMEAAKAEQDILAKMLTGGELEDGEGSYGTIEFRFKAVAGTLYILDTVQEADVPAHFKKYPNLVIEQKTQAQLNEGAQVYQAANLPYQDTRVRPGYIFVEQSLMPAFDQAWLEHQDPNQNIVRRNPSANVSDPINNVGLFEGPDNAKGTQKAYSARATRGSRDAGQKVVMGNMSAHDYVARFSLIEANQYDWEWLHLRGSRLGGLNRPENLVAGTAAANTHMIPYERAIFKLSGLATHNKPVNVSWNATLRKDASGNDTHIGDMITIIVQFPNGPPDNAAAKDVQLFANPVIFSASEGAGFTKLDRDIVDA